MHKKAKSMLGSLLGGYSGQWTSLCALQVNCLWARVNFDHANIVYLSRGFQFLSILNVNSMLILQNRTNTKISLQCLIFGLLYRFFFPMMVHMLPEFCQCSLVKNQFYWLLSFLCTTACIQMHWPYLSSTLSAFTIYFYCISTTATLGARFDSRYTTHSNEVMQSRCSMLIFVVYTSQLLWVTFIYECCTYATRNTFVLFFET